MASTEDESPSALCSPAVQAVEGVVSLLCPVTRKRIVHARRGESCTHPAAFDESGYKLLKPGALCPCCSRAVQRLVDAEDVQLALSSLPSTALSALVNADGVVLPQQICSGKTATVVDLVSDSVVDDPMQPEDITVHLAPGETLGLELKKIDSPLAYCVTRFTDPTSKAALSGVQHLDTLVCVNDCDVPSGSSNLAEDTLPIKHKDQQRKVCFRRSGALLRASLRAALSADRAGSSDVATAAAGIVSVKIESQSLANSASDAAALDVAVAASENGFARRPPRRRRGGGSDSNQAPPKVLEDALALSAMYSTAELYRRACVPVPPRLLAALRTLNNEDLPAQNPPMSQDLLNGRTDASKSVLESVGSYGGGPCTVVKARAKKHLKICGLSVAFPFEQPLRPQMQIMNTCIRALKPVSPEKGGNGFHGSHALIESPTGTGKSAALLCSALAYQRQCALDGWADRAARGKEPLQIWYLTRTHTQVASMVGDLRKTPYRPRMSVLGSRRVSCIHEDVAGGVDSKGKYIGVNAACRNKRRAKKKDGAAAAAACGCSYFHGVGSGEWVERVSSELCNRVDAQGLRNAAASVEGMCEEGCTGGVHDIEDIKVKGLESNACPYFTMQAMIKQAQIIFMPYNYVIDAKIRESMLNHKKLENVILIVDEGHNIEGSCREAGSTDSPLFSLMTMVRDLCVLHSYTDWQMSGGSGKDTMQDLVMAVMPLLDKLIKFIQKEGKTWERTRMEQAVKVRGLDKKRELAVRNWVGRRRNNGNLVPMPRPSPKLLELRQQLSRLDAEALARTPPSPYAPAAPTAASDVGASGSLHVPAAPAVTAATAARLEAQCALRSEEVRYNQLHRGASQVLTFFNEAAIDEGSLKNAASAFERILEGLERESDNDGKPASFGSRDALTSLISSLLLAHAHPYDYHISISAKENGPTRRDDPSSRKTQPCHERSDFARDRAGRERACCCHWSNYQFGGKGTVFRHGPYLDKSSRGSVGGADGEDDVFPPWLYSFGLWLMNPAVTFDPIAKEAHSVIVASGTLQPLKPEELGPSLCRRNLLKTKQTPVMELEHVVSRKQVFVKIVTHGCNNVLMANTFNDVKSINKSCDGRWERQLGETILELLKQLPSPSGAIVFLPSYSKLRNVHYHWNRNSTLLYRLQALGGGSTAVVFEPSGGDVGEFNEARETYLGAIDNGRRAVMVAVFRGKMSEGISFNDAYCRSVFLVSVPYPNLTDLRVEAKKAWNNERLREQRQLPRSVGAVSVSLPISGDLWYNQEAFRAYNQALGRCIRHRNDYGAIFLLDCRLSNDHSGGARLQASLPAWIRSARRKLLRDSDASFIQHWRNSRHPENFAGLCEIVREFFIEAPIDIARRQAEAAARCRSDIAPNTSVLDHGSPAKRARLDRGKDSAAARSLVSQVESIQTNPGLDNAEGHLRADF